MNWYQLGQQHALSKLGMATANDEHLDQTYQRQALPISDLKAGGPDGDEIWNRFDRTMQTYNTAPGTTDLRWI